MTPISNKETALLMLLAEQSMHAYQIEKIVEEREMRFWTEISMSSIYKLLNKLAREKLISKRGKNSENGINKNVFSGYISFPVKRNRVTMSWNGWVI